MAIRADLKRKLRASDRRRRRRNVDPNPAPARDTPLEGLGRGLDVVGLIVKDLVQIARSDRDLVDAAATAGLRACLSGNPPKGVQSNLVYDQVQSLSQRDDVSERAVRSAIKSLLEIASKHQGKQADAKSFLGYLGMLVS